MRPQEAEWVGALLSAIDSSSLAPVVELGTTSRKFREVTKPHIAMNIHMPLAERGVPMITSDLFDADGVDIAGDIYDPQVQEKLLAVGARSLIVCNIFEHVTDVSAFAAVCDKLLLPGGLMIVTVPFDYPYHLDPIDRMFRPTPEEVIALFPGYTPLKSAVVVSDTYAHDLRQAGDNVPVTTVKELARSLALRGGLQRSLARIHRLLWLFKPYTVTCVAMHKPGTLPS